MHAITGVYNESNVLFFGTTLNQHFELKVPSTVFGGSSSNSSSS
jgi:hypothetical protein